MYLAGIWSSRIMLIRVGNMAIKSLQIITSAYMNWIESFLTVWSMWGVFVGRTGRTGYNRLLWLVAQILIGHCKSASSHTKPFFVVSIVHDVSTLHTTSRNLATVLYYRGNGLNISRQSLPMAPGMRVRMGVLFISKRGGAFCIRAGIYLMLQKMRMRMLN